MDLPGFFITALITMFILGLAVNITVQLLIK